MKRILLILALICMFVLPVFSQSGNYTTNEYFYLPLYGAYGIDEYNEYNLYMEKADNQIETNKDNIADIDLSLYYLKTEINTQAKVEAIWDVSLVNDGDLDLYYLKTAINTQGKMETIWGVTLATDTELAALKFTDLTDTPANYTDQAGKYVKVNVGETALEFGTGAGGASQLSDLSDVGVTTPTDKYVLVADGDSWESRALVEADISDLDSYATLTGDEVLTNKDINFVNALGTDHFYSGELDSQPVGENVVFGQLLYYDWTDVEWKLAKADAFGTAKATRIALETKANGETCLMLIKGYIRDDSAFDFGAARVFLNDDTAGTCDDTAPAESGDQIFVVGEAKSADILFFDPGKDVGEI